MTPEELRAKERVTARQASADAVMLKAAQQRVAAVIGRDRFLAAQKALTPASAPRTAVTAPASAPKVTPVAAKAAPAVASAAVTVSKAAAPVPVLPASGQSAWEASLTARERDDLALIRAAGLGPSAEKRAPDVYTAIEPSLTARERDDLALLRAAGFIPSTPDRGH